MSKKYIVAIIFKNGMKLCSKPLSRERAREIYSFKTNELKFVSTQLMEFCDSVFKIEDIFMITMVEEQKND